MHDPLASRAWLLESFDDVRIIAERQGGLGLDVGVVAVLEMDGHGAAGLGRQVWTAAVNRAAVVGIVGQNLPEYLDTRTAYVEGRLDPSRLDPEQPDYVFLDPDYIADAMMHAIDQPWGVSIGEITVRAMGDHFLL